MYFAFSCALFQIPARSSGWLNSLERVCGTSGAGVSLDEEPKSSDDYGGSRAMAGFITAFRGLRNVEKNNGAAVP